VADRSGVVRVVQRNKEPELPEAELVAVD